VPPVVDKLKILVPALNKIIPGVIHRAIAIYGPSLSSAFAGGQLHITDPLRTFHGLNHCRQVADLLLQEAKGTDLTLKQVADSPQDNHHFLIFHEPQLHDKPDPLVIDPTYKQFFSFAVMDSVLKYILIQNPNLRAQFNHYRKSQTFDRDKIEEMQLTVSLLDPTFIGPHSQILKLLDDISKLRSEAYKFPPKIDEKLQESFLYFFGKPETMVEVKKTETAEGVKFILAPNPLFPSTPPAETVVKNLQQLDNPLPKSR